MEHLLDNTNIEIDIVPGADHFFADHLKQMISQVSTYLDVALMDGAFQDPDFDPLA